MLGDELQIAVEFRDSPRMRAVRAAHHGDQKTAVRERIKFIGDGR